MPEIAYGLDTAYQHGGLFLEREMTNNVDVELIILIYHSGCVIADGNTFFNWDY